MQRHHATCKSQNRKSFLRTVSSIRPSKHHRPARVLPQWHYAAITRSDLHQIHSPLKLPLRPNFSKKLCSSRRPKSTVSFVRYFRALGHTPQRIERRPAVSASKVPRLKLLDNFVIGMRFKASLLRWVMGYSSERFVCQHMTTSKLMFQCQSLCHHHFETAVPARPWP
jgi:hypothetical protein